MASAHNRGTREDPSWYAKVKHLDGKWRVEPTYEPTKKLARAWAERRQAEIDAGKPDPRKAALCGDLFPTWSKALSNRNADDDRSRTVRHLTPAFGHRRISEVTIKTVMEWIDEMKAGTAPTVESTKKGHGRTVAKLSGGSMRANLNLLSRFFSWAVERGHAQLNPVRLIPVGRRPHQAAKSDTPWLDDDATVRKIVSALPSPLGLMFYLGNRSGLRTGELCGLRMSDLGFLEEGTIRVRFSYDGPLKEDKHGAGKVKWAPSPDNATPMLVDWLTRRRAAGAGPEDLVFPPPERVTKKGRVIERSTREEAHKQNVERAWNDVREKLDLSLTFYQATRHSFVSRNLSRGASLDEVSAAVGHSSPVVTRRYYDHFVRKTFSPTLRQGLDVGRNIEGAAVIAMSDFVAKSVATSDAADLHKDKAPGNLVASEGLLL